MIGIEKSLAMQVRAKKRVPGMTQLLSKRPDQFSYGVWPGYFEKAKGVSIWDLDGNQYTDMSICGIGANILGYADPDVDGAVMEVISKGTGCTLNCPEEVELADLLCELHPWAEKVRFTRTGGESMAVAIRIARAATRKDIVAFCGYHGWHDWYLAANIGTEDALEGHFLSGLSPNGVPKGLKGTALPFRYNRIGDLKTIVSSNKGLLAAIVLEPIRNEYPTKEFIKGIRKLADECGAVLIVDEISAGFRMNTGGAHLKLAIRPDIAVFSKALGNGYPIGAVIGRGNVMEAAQLSFISSTNWTERVGPAAALATIRKHRKHNVADHLMGIGEEVRKGWKALAEKHGLKIAIEGIPPLSHFTFFAEQSHRELKAYYIQEMLKKGILASDIFYAMFAHSSKHVDEYLRATDSVWDKIKSLLAAGESIAKLFKGESSAAGFKRLT